MEARLSKTERRIWQGLGFIFLFIIWDFFPRFDLVPKKILPLPIDVFKSYFLLITEYDLINNIIFSLKINIYGYIEAIIFSILFGFVLSLNKYINALFEKILSSFRFLPLPALIGIFIVAFQMSIKMKVQFLAFSIIVYLLPVVAQRVNEVEKVYIDTLKTLGANKLQVLYHVYLPYVFHHIIDDIRIILAMSWTYIIIAEGVNREGGIGMLALSLGRKGDTDKAYALYLLIIVIGILQDQLFTILDKIIFPHKYKTYKKVAK